MEELKTLLSYLKASNADGLAVLEATTTWCSQCKTIKPFVEKLMGKYPDARFYNYDTGIVVPSASTFHIFKDGDLVDSITGAKVKELEAAISKSYDGKVESDE